MRTFIACLVVATLHAPAIAQSTAPGQAVGITGLVRPTPGPVGCGPATHMLDCTSVFLTGDTSLLDSLVGQQAQLFGEETAVPGAPCTLIKVASAVVPPPATLDWCGTASPGCDVRFVICPGGLSQFWLFAALGPGYHPLIPSKGTWLLGDPSFLLATGLGGAACHVLDAKVPDDTAIVGQTVWLQAARRDIGPIGPVELTNVICLTVLPAKVPCLQPGC
jgi:hypothetical protein